MGGKDEIHGGSHRRASRMTARLKICSLIFTISHQLQSVKDPTIRPYRHTGDAFVQIYKTEGLKGFYRGLLPSLFGVSHVAVQFPLYESFKGWASECL